MFEDLCKKQIEMLLYMELGIQRQGYPPAVREIGQNLDLSFTTVNSHLDELETKGYIKRNLENPMTIQIIKVEDSDEFLIPIEKAYVLMS